MGIHQCKITVPGRHVKAGLPNEAKEQFGRRGPAGNTTRPWHTSERPVARFIKGMSCYASYVADHLRGCNSCCSEIKTLYVSPDFVPPRTFDRTNQIPRLLVERGQLSKDEIPFVFRNGTYRDLVWLEKKLKGADRIETLIRTAIAFGKRSSVPVLHLVPKRFKEEVFHNWRERQMTEWNLSFNALKSHDWDDRFGYKTNFLVLWLMRNVRTILDFDQEVPIDLLAISDRADAIRAVRLVHES